MRHSALITCLALAGTITPAFADGAPKAKDDQQDQRIEIISHEDGKQYQITIEDGKVDARVDGLRIAPDHIRRDGNRVALLDDDGNVIRSFSVGPSGVPEAGSSGYLFTTSPMITVAPQVAVEMERPPVMLGVLLDNPSDVLQSQLGVSPYAVVIEKVLDDLPAAKAGLEQWDIVTKINGRSLDDEGVLHKILMDSKPGDKLDLVVLRHNKEVKLSIDLEAYDAAALGNETVAAPTAPSYNFQGLIDQESLQKALEAAKRKIESAQGKAGNQEAIQELEQAMRQLDLQNRSLGAMRWLDDKGRLVERQLGDMAGGDMDKRLQELDEKFSDRLDKLEGRWQDMQDMFDKLLKRLDEATKQKDGKD
ncbi:MAG: PDZ domain-containing protein [Phycisphaeraceae bacterium]|nr:MAG: PDZ domain-containing protein [Phycisphaeraceae bacterium]